MKQFDARFILPLNITIQKHSQIEKNWIPQKIIVNNLIQLGIKVLLEMEDFSISMMMVNYIYIIY